MTLRERFGDDFCWGSATASYQVEGAVDVGGRGTSIWDTFARTPGRVANGDTGDVACDHYHRYADDIRLMAEANLDAYRFSFAWPRIQPGGRGPANAEGLAFYDRLVDSLLENHIQPWGTLFHWDLPQELQDAGGWLERETAERFAEYAGLVAERFADRLVGWMTLNEPYIHMLVGHATGHHAPGLELGLGAFPVAHHQLLAHGLGVQALRAAGARNIGITNSYAPAWPRTQSQEDTFAAVAMDAIHNRMFTEPLLRGAYPELALDVFRRLAPDSLASIRPGDLDTIRQPIDFLGVNYYAPDHVHADGDAMLKMSTSPVPGRETTAMGWSVVPEALTQMLVELARTNTQCPPLIVTENGCAVDDQVVDGRVNDEFRVRFLADHIDAVAKAREQGADVRGYFAWSLLDNFEWAEGYAKRFGLVHIDFETLERTPKDSYRWLAGELARQG
ncbi:GH1 family beta-glucosidase [Mariniluteicoccus flavus]